MKIGILEPDRFSDVALQQLEALGDVLKFDKQSLDEFLAELDVLFIRLGYPIDTAFLDRAPRLKFICSPTTGHTHIDVDALEQRSVSLVSLKRHTHRLGGIRATPEHTFGLLIALLRNYIGTIRHCDAGIWDRNLHVGEELAGKSVGIIGLGRVGRILASYCQAFDANVKYFDIGFPEAEKSWDEANSIPDLINVSDVILVCASEQADGSKVLDGDLLAMCGGKFLINTARGELLDEDVLLDMAQNGKFKGLALDVIENELGANRFDSWRAVSLKHNVIITPHIGGATIESMHKTELLIVELLREALRG